MNSADAWLPENCLNKSKLWTTLVTCEHAANRIPERYQHLFASAGNLLKTHRGYDIGALALAQHLSKVLEAPLFIGRYSRLLADLNRHPCHRNVFSKFTDTLEAKEKQGILKKYHEPYRTDVKTHVQQEIESSRKVLHLSVHSFTPVLNGVTRTADIGFLYDPKRKSEKQITDCLIKQFKNHLKNLRCRRNYPYLGISDSLTTSLRKEFTDTCYAGIEFEVNQRLASGNPGEWETFLTAFAQTVRTALTVNAIC
jgi:predicted N-formylglutamate amidohydrolase